MEHAARIALVASLVGLLSPIARADQTDTLIVQITQGLDGDAARATKLVEAAGTLEADTPAAVKVLERAVAYAERSAADVAGLQAGLDALDALQDKAPDRKTQWSRKQLDLCRAAYRGATDETRPAVGRRLMKILDGLGTRAAAAKDWAPAAEAFAEAYRIASAIARRRLEFEAKKAHAEHFLQAERKLKTFQKNAADHPDDARIHQLLLRALVVDLDDPNQAKDHLGGLTSQVYATYVPMAAREVGEVPEAACAELRDWYAKSLAAQTTPVPKRRMLERAGDYARRVLDLHTAKDAARLAAQTRLETIEKDLQALEPVPTMLRRLRYVDLAKLIDLDVDATADAWTFVKGAFCCEVAKNASLRFPVAATGSYRLSLIIAKAQKANELRFAFPVGGRAVRLEIREYYAPSSRSGASRGSGRGGGRGGFSRLRPRNVTWLRLGLSGVAKRSTTSHAREITPNYERSKWVPYALEIAVQQTSDRVQVAVLLNRQKWVSWSGDKKDLRESSDGSIHVTCPNAGLIVRDAKLRPTDGEVTFSEASSAASQPVRRDEDSRPKWPFPRRDDDRRHTPDR